MKTLLYLTDFYYEARGRKYYEEDLFITSRLLPHFNLLIGHPQQALAYTGCADLIVFRNTGPVLAYKEYFDRFVKEVVERGLVTFNSFDGKADMKGKGYLLELMRQGYAVIPTVATVDELQKLGNPERYIVKLLNGADSIGMEVLTRDELLQARPEGKLIQPLVDFEYEVSFYYLNNEFQYALYAPDRDKRWALTEYNPSAEDLLFADAFLKWNAMARGIVRVDACRLKNGGLWLVELEDLNPFLSLDLLSEAAREQFIENFIAALKRTVGEG